MNTLPMLLLIVATGLLSAAMVSAASVLDSLRSDHRVLVVFAAKADDESLAKQRKRFGEFAVSMRERDVTLIEVIGDTVRRDGEAIEASADELREQEKVAKEAFAVHLIGKDGGTKLRRDKPVEMQEIADLIDSMPMRQQEMKER